MVAVPNVRAELHGGDADGSRVTGQAAESSERLEAESNLAVSLLHQGKGAEAEPLLRQLHEVQMRALGADVTVNYRTNPAWHEAILDATGGRGADVVLNTVGIGELERSLMACASNARVMQIGANPVKRGATAQGPGGASMEVPVGLRDFPRGMIMRGLRIQGVIVGSRAMLQAALQAAALNRIAPVIDRVFAFDQAPDALRYMETGEKIGKIVIRVS